MLLCQKSIFEILAIFPSISFSAFSAFPLFKHQMRPSSSQEKVEITSGREKQSFQISDSSSFRAQKRPRLEKD